MKIPRLNTVVHLVDTCNTANPYRIMCTIMSLDIGMKVHGIRGHPDNVKSYKRKKSLSKSR